MVGREGEAAKAAGQALQGIGDALDRMMGPVHRAAVHQSRISGSGCVACSFGRSGEASLL